MTNSSNKLATFIMDGQVFALLTPISIKDLLPVVANVDPTVLCRSFALSCVGVEKFGIGG